MNINMKGREKDHSRAIESIDTSSFEYTIIIPPILAFFSEVREVISLPPGYPPPLFQWYDSVQANLRLIFIVHKGMEYTRYSLKP